MEGVMKTEISGKEAARVAEDMAKPDPIRVVDLSEAQEAPSALVPSPGSELDRKVPPRVRKLLPRNDQLKAPTPDLEGHRKRLREALGKCKTNWPCTSAGGVERGQGAGALAGQRRCRTAAAGCTAGCPRAPRRGTQMLSSTDTIRLKQSPAGPRLGSFSG